MNQSQSLIELGKAISKAQAEMTGAKKGKDNPFFKSKYADLSSVMEATKEALANNGLSIVQFPITQDGKCGVTTILLHESGEFISQACLLACSKQDPQAYGSAITYARRYGWQAVCGIPSEDDDGNAATQRDYKVEESARDMFDAKKDSFTAEFANWCMDNMKKHPEKVIEEMKKR